MYSYLDQVTKFTISSKVMYIPSRKFMQITLLSLLFIVKLWISLMHRVVAKFSIYRKVCI